ncbi:hypothetical protein CK203_081011 [Vitis vinifera]|uniref:Retrotransposon gag domain-containing protein n=1 Tax=Vitis vinifera TaxID=29760 RepID=A0A438EN02_VITVI|nr:hypothetical protein CK203_081011 [Vitis vinifera]
MEHTAGRGRKDKSRDALANMEARLAKVELAMADTGKGRCHTRSSCPSKTRSACSLVWSQGWRPWLHAWMPETKRFDKSWPSKTAVSARVMATHEAPRVERYFEAIALTDEATKVRTATLYLTDNATLWWRRRFADIERGTCTIDTWDAFKREIKRQFYPEDVAYLARKSLKRLKHTGSIREYVKEFSTLMLEIPNMAEEELLFNFMDNLQSWAEQELRRRGVQDLATAMAVAESLVDYRRGDSSKPKPPSKGNQAKGGGDKRTNCFLCDGPHWARDCPKRKALNAMIEEKEQEGDAKWDRCSS